MIAVDAEASSTLTPAMNQRPDANSPRSIASNTEVRDLRLWAENIEIFVSQLAKHHRIWVEGLGILAPQESFELVQTWIVQAGNFGRRFYADHVVLKLVHRLARSKREFDQLVSSVSGSDGPSSPITISQTSLHFAQKPPRVLRPSQDRPLSDQFYSTPVDSK